LGGTKADIGNAIALDSHGNIIVTGQTKSEDFPITPGTCGTEFYNDGSYDAFIAKIDQEGSKLNFSMFWGGSRDNEGHDIVVDPFDNIYMAGFTVDHDFPHDWVDKGSTENEYGYFFLNINENGKKRLFCGVWDEYLKDHPKVIGIGFALDPKNNWHITSYSSGVPPYSRFGLTDIEVWLRIFDSVIDIKSISVSSKYGPTNQIYSKLCPYTFRVEVIDTLAIKDLCDVELSLDPKGTNIKLSWNRSTNEISKINDPNNYITLEPSSKAYNDLWNKWTIDFNVTFNWTYPDEEFNDVQARATSLLLSPAWLNATKMYKVENDLVFDGELIVRGEDDRVIKENELVKGGEVLNWTGLTTVYEGTINLYPPKDEYYFSVWDEDGNYWLNSPEPGFWCDIVTKTSPYTDYDGYEFTINILGIPPECDKTNESFTIRIDADNVTYSNPIPNNTSWQTDSEVEVGITINDYGGGLVNGEKVFYSVYKNNDEGWTNWLSVPKMTSDFEILVNTIAEFDEGIDNYIKWCAEDSVGNGPTESEAYQVLVDTQELNFSDPWPKNTYISPSETVEVGINISDLTSGVDASSIEYSISENAGMTWYEWESLKGFETGNNLMIRFNITLPDSLDNRIRWRACDIAGNGPIRSGIFPIYIQVQHLEPKIKLISPPNDSIVTTSSVDLLWDLENVSSDNQNISYNLLIHFEEEYNIGFCMGFCPVGTIFISENHLTTNNFTVYNLIDGYYAFWEVTVIVDNESFRSETWWFFVDFTSAIYNKTYKVDIRGPKFISSYAGENLSMLLTVTNFGNSRDSIKVRIIGGSLSVFGRFEKNYPIKLTSFESKKVLFHIELIDTIQPGTYEIIIEAYSLTGGKSINDTHTIIILVKSPETSSNNKSISEKNDWFLYSLISIIIVILLLLILVRKKSTKQKDLTISKKSNPDKTSLQNNIPQLTKTKPSLKSPSELAKPPTTQVSNQSANPSVLPPAPQSPSHDTQPVPHSHS
jgi:hypothetical protein